MLTHMFWAYGDLSRLELLCANSFIGNGFDLQIWTYGNFTRALTGASIRNAREILPESKIFLNRRGSYAGFSDLFRYAVLSRYGGLYVDTDVVAIRPASALPRRRFLVTERDQQGNIKINGNVVYNPNPQIGNVIDLALVYADRFPKQDITWSEIGPDLLTAIVNIYPLHGFEIYPTEFANPINHWDCPRALIEPTEWTPPESTFFIHLYNEMWRRSGQDKDATYGRDSLFEALVRRYF